MYHDTLEPISHKSFIHHLAKQHSTLTPDLRQATKTSWAWPRPSCSTRCTGCCWRLLRSATTSPAWATAGPRAAAAAPSSSLWGTRDRLRGPPAPAPALRSEGQGPSTAAPCWRRTSTLVPSCSTRVWPQWSCLCSCLRRLFIG